MSGRWISIDGCEGSGKTTLINKLKKKYPDFIYLPEFSDSIIGKTLHDAVKQTPYIISNSIIGASLMFLSDYFHMVETVIVPNIERGSTIISDRGFLSKIVVQAAVMSEFYEKNQVRKALIELFNLSITPHYTILMEAPLKVIKSRLINRDGHYDAEREKLIKSIQKETTFFADYFDLKTSRICSDKDIEEVVLDFEKNLNITPISRKSN